MTLLTLSPLIFTPVFEIAFLEVALRFSGCMLIAVVGSLLFYALSLRQAGRILSKTPV